MGKKEETTLGSRVGKIARRVLQGTQQKPHVFLDTGAVIDFEREIALCRLKDSSVTPDMFYSLFFGLVGDNVWVNDGVFEEIESHHIHHLLGGRPEICDESYRNVSGMHVRFKDFSRGSIFCGDLDKIRHSTYWASKLAFPNGHKKLCDDEASCVDRGLISSAFHIATIDRNVPYRRQNVFLDFSPVENTNRASVVVVSPDSHITETIKVLTDSHPTVTYNHPEINWRFGYNGVRAVSSR